MPRSPQASRPVLRLLQLDQDIAALQNLLDACSDYFLFSEGAPPPPTAAADEFLNLPSHLDASAKFIFGYPDNGPLTAIIEGLHDYPHAGVWYVGLMLVRPAFRSAGLGSSIFSAFEGLARQAGISEIRLCVFDESPLALRFWQRNGFVFHRAIPPQSFGLRTHARTELRKVLAVI